MTDAEAIRADVRLRGITRLCHMTQSRKLPHIFGQTHAILPTQELRDRYPDLLDAMDTQRRDGRLDCLCCSIEYPNVWYFQHAKPRNAPFEDWVILCLDPCLLWQRAALFSPRSAAAWDGTLLRPGWTGWNALFQEEVQGSRGRTFRRTPHLLPYCPTDGQAEVLIPGVVPLRYVRAIVAVDADQAHREQTRCRMLDLQGSFEWRIAPALFNPEWRTTVEQGRRPVEHIV